MGGWATAWALANGGRGAEEAARPVGAPSLRVSESQLWVSLASPPAVLPRPKMTPGLCLDWAPGGAAGWGQGPVAAGRPGRAAEIKIWPFSPAWTRACHTGTFCVVRGPGLAVLDVMHVTESSHRRWKWVSTLKDQCKTSEVGQLRNLSQQEAG